MRFKQNTALHILGLGLLLGVVLLVAKGPPTTGDEERLVVVTANDLAQLRVGFMRTWQREPTQMELQRELEKFIREEVLYREALARGYDRDDLVVRRAMQRKMEFLAQSQVANEPPTDEEIQAYFALRQERYRTPTVISFAQVYFNPEGHEGGAERDAIEALEGIRRADPDPAQLSRWGDAVMLQSYYPDQTEQDVQSTFGAEFATAVLALEPGKWQGPVRSAYGLHLVRVTRREESRLPDWKEVRSRIVTDMEYEARNAAQEQLFQEIAQGYQVVFDGEVRALMESGRQ
jgi:peptidyl-prolyl cis-trans isomerase C